jgi:hypothetical protein
MRHCKLCSTDKEESEFYTSEKTARCKECDKARKRKERIERPHTIPDRKAWLKKNYGITIEDYNRMFEEQNGTCAICKQEGIIKKGTLCVDHCHTTGVVRGLLCHSCNVGLGHFLDNKETMKTAIKYLEKYESRCE